MLLLFPIKLVKLKIVNDTVTSITGKRGKTTKDTIQMYRGLTLLRMQGCMLVRKKIRSALADFEQRDTHIVDVVAKLK